MRGRIRLDAQYVKRTGRQLAIGSATALALAATISAVHAQSIHAVSDLQFGGFIAGSGGTVVVSPGSARNATGGVLLVGQGAGVAAAQFNVTGTSNASYTISLPADNTVLLTDGSHTMALNSFVSQPAFGTLSGGGAQTIRVGATLIVGSGQVPGGYAGSFSLTVNY
jgi:hypothetical protein